MNLTKLLAAAQALMGWVVVTAAAMAVLMATPGHGQAQSAQAGRAKATTCLACHGVVAYEIGYPETYRVPMLAGQNAAYVVAALTAYQKGDRKHPAMRIIANRLNSEDMADLAQYFEGDPGQEPARGSNPQARLALRTGPPAEVGRLLQRGGCAACHGETFTQPTDRRAPKLAGQYPEYLLASMAAYGRSGFFVGRSHDTMSEQMRRFTAHEMGLLAQYLGELEPSVKTLSQAPGAGR